MSITRKESYSKKPITLKPLGEKMQRRFYFVTFLILSIMCFPSHASEYTGFPEYEEEPDNSKKKILRLPVISNSSAFRDFILYPQEITKQRSKKGINNDTIYEPSDVEIIFTYEPEQILVIRIIDFKIAIRSLKRQVPCMKAETNLKEVIRQVYDETPGGYLSFWYGKELDVHEIESELSDDSKTYVIESSPQLARKEIIRSVKETSNKTTTSGLFAMDQALKETLVELKKKQWRFSNKAFNQQLHSSNKTVNSLREELGKLLNEYEELLSEYKETLQNYKNADNDLYQRSIYDYGFCGNLRETLSDIELDWKMRAQMF